MTTPAPAAFTWTEDGAPFSNRFNDRYHSFDSGGVHQALGSFLHGCGLPEKWQHQKQWRILETGFGMGLNFLVTWQAWRDDPLRCQRLDFISTEAYPVSAEALLQAARSNYPQLLPLAEQLVAQYLDMHSGIHRLSFDDNRVHLTLAIGDAKTFMREQGWRVDSIYLDGFKPTKNPDIWDDYTLKAAAKCSIANHTIAASWCIARRVQDALTRCGFHVERVPGMPPKRHNLRALYAPAWQTHEPPALLPTALRQLCQPQHTAARQCLVIGAGLAGAAMARQMAEHGWSVTVLDAHAEPALGASALPVGLFAPYITTDDAPLSRLSRAGVKATRRTARALLEEHRDWAASGVLEHRIGKKWRQPTATVSQPNAGESAWPATALSSNASVLAQATQCAAAGIAPQAMGSSAPPSPKDTGAQETQAAQQSEHPRIWHALAGWIKPRALVKTLLGHPGIHWQGHQSVARIERAAALADSPAEGHSQSATPAQPPLWQALDAQGNCLAAAPLVIVAAAFESQALISPWQGVDFALNRVRGQVAYGALPAGQEPLQGLAPFPINGKGSFIHVPSASETGGQGLWISGGTFDRDCPSAPSQAETDRALQENTQRLALLMPHKGPALAQALLTAPEAAPVQTWWAQRCTVPDRTPFFGPVSAHPEHNGLLLAAGLGSRGLTLALLSAEILAACLHDAPLPVEKQLAQLILTTRAFAPQ